MKVMKLALRVGFSGLSCFLWHKAFNILNWKCISLMCARDIIDLNRLTCGPEFSLQSRTWTGEPFLSPPWKSRHQPLSEWCICIMNELKNLFLKIRAETFSRILSSFLFFRQNDYYPIYSDLFVCLIQI